MIQPSEFFEALRGHGFSFFTGVPDSLLSDLCAYIDDHVDADHHVINANEGSAVALAAGYHLATGKIPVVYLQNSGTGNILNPLLSLVDPAVYAIPVLFLIGWRGEPGVPDEPQHVSQGRAMSALLDAVGLDHDVVGAGTSDYAAVIGRSVAQIEARSAPRALLVRRGTFAPYRSTRHVASDLPCTRADAIEAVIAALERDDLVVSTTGLTSRELYAFRERAGQGHDRDFLTVGSMGHASQIALGLAKHQPGRRIVCLDGDGAVLMHMGSLAIIGTQAPSNLMHVVLNNGAHDSVGGQPTAARQVDLSAIASACGYRSAVRPLSETEISEAVARARQEPGPSFVEIRVNSEPHADVGRPTTTPAENKAALMGALRDGS